MRFGSHQLWKVLQIVAAAIAIWTSAKFTAEIFQYLRYSRAVEAEIVDWGVLEYAPDVFKICATYEFTVDGEKFSSQHLFTKLSFRNRYAAEETVRIWTNRKWTTWYRLPAPPRSVLEREFPLKSCVHMMISLGVVVYFAWLKRYLYKRSFA
jgi:hypothetical protein